MATVLVLGGGVAGLSAAHELAERDFRTDGVLANLRLCGAAPRQLMRR